MIVANNSDKPWTVDTREQRMTLADRGESRAAYASADAGAPPPVVIASPGGKRTVDLYFPLPHEMSEASELPSFDVIWTVQTDARVVTERTSFERVKLEPAPAAEHWGYAGVMPYWYDPYYPYGAWPGAVLPPVYVERPVIIRPGAPPSRRVH
jgi:hypothetical protein